VSLPPFAEALSIGEAPHHFESHPRLASALPLLMRITLQRGSGGVPNKKRIPNKGAGGDAGLPMAIIIITCAIIDLVAIALFFGLCVFVCP
jgi:hypothetical protein